MAFTNVLRWKSELQTSVQLHVCYIKSFFQANSFRNTILLNLDFELSVNEVLKFRFLYLSLKLGGILLLRLR